MKYYVTNENLIPLHAQPEQGYTKLQAISRAQREVKECVNLFGCKESEYVPYFHIVDDSFHYCKELDNAI